MPAPATLDLEAFAHVVAHDLGAPIRGMSIHLRLLSQDLAKGDHAQAKARMELVQRRLHRLDEMLRRVRDFSKVHVAGSHDGTVELGGLVAEALEHIDRGTATIDCAGNGRVKGAPMLVLTILQELIRNAISHHDGQPTLTIHIEPGLMTITDDGPGLTSESQDELALFSLTGHHVRDGGGSGLALSRYIARHLGGDLTLVSPVAEGRGVQARLQFLPA